MLLPRSCFPAKKKRLMMLMIMMMVITNDNTVTIMTIMLRKERECGTIYLLIAQ